MAKFANKHDVYTEASFRLGRMSDSAKELFGGNISVAYLFIREKLFKLQAVGSFMIVTKNGNVGMACLFPRKLQN